MQTIGKYQVEKVLGRGGMGTVYQALDPIIHRRVAVKTMIPDLAEAPDLRARFLREAQAAGGLRHRNIVTVYDLGEDNGQPYIAMEFIEGSDLEHVIQNREPYPIEWKIDVIRQVCEGLGYAHRNGIVHRDVKPANIRVTPEGEVKIMDFGIAHLQSSTMTKSGLVLGTVHYMAPEQVEGQKVDLRADIFSVGAIAYELFAYRRAWDGDSLTAVMFKIVREPLDLRPIPKTAYSPGLEAIVARALAKRVEDRYQTLEEMRDDLERLVRETADRQTPSAVAGEGIDPARAAALVESARRRLAEGDTEAALALAREAAAAAPEDARARAALRDAESEGLRRRVEREMSEIRAGMERARADGQLQKALSLCRRLLELDPDDQALVRTAQAIEASILEKEVEQLSSMALGYAADGDMELAQKIAGRIGRLAPDSPRYAQLRSYLEEERARRTAEALTATAQEHLALGNLEEARAAAEEALAAVPDHPVAREIRDRAGKVLSVRRTPVPPSAAGPETVTLAAVPAPAAETISMTPPQAGAPEAVPLPAPPPAPPAPPESAFETPTVLMAAAEPAAPRHEPPAADPVPEARTPTPVPAAVPAVAAAPPSDESRRHAEAAALASAALNAFMQSNHAKARKAVEKALALEPENRRAKELAKILSALG